MAQQIHISYKGLNLLVENTGHIYDSNGVEIKQYKMGDYFCIQPYSPLEYHR